MTAQARSPYRKTFPGNSDSLTAIRREVSEVAREWGFDGPVLEDVRTAVSEAATNAVIHARAAPDSDLIVRVELAGALLRVVVADQGLGMRPRADSPGLGLGLPIISTLARRMEIVSPGRDGATEVHMYFGRTAQLIDP